MKNKKLLYVLIPLSTIIWGMILYKIISVIKKPVIIPEQFLVHSIKGCDSKQEDTFSIIANYRDPFLGELSKSYEQSEINNTAPVKNVTLKQLVFNWPLITYKGLIENKKASHKTGIIHFNNKSCLIREGDTLQGVSFFRLFKDSVKLKSGKQFKTVVIADMD